MPNQSKVLDHPQRAAIDAMLSAGRSQRSVAVMFGLTKDVVRRYVERGQLRVPEADDPRVVDTRTMTVYPSRDAFIEAVAAELDLPAEDLKRHVRDGHARA